MSDPLNPAESDSGEYLSPPPDWLKSGPAPSGVRLPPPPGWLSAGSPPAGAVTPGPLPVWLAGVAQQRTPSAARPPAPSRAAPPPAPAEEQTAHTGFTSELDALRLGESVGEDALPPFLAQQAPAEPEAEAEPPAPVSPAEPASELPPSEHTGFTAELEAIEGEEAETPSTDKHLPAWLSEGDEAIALPPPEPPAEPPSDELPDWMKAPTGVEAETPASQPAAETADEIPAWMKPGEAAEGASEDWVAEAAPPPAASGEQMPDWLTATEGTEAAAPPAPAEPVESVPDWLAGSEAPAEEAAPAPQAEAEVPGWVTGEEPPPPVPEVPEPEPEPEPAPAQPPPPPPVESTAPSPAPAPIPAGGDVPDWLADMAGGQPPAPPPAEPAAPSPALTAAGGDVPDWLSDLAGGQPPAPPAAEPAAPLPVEPVEPAAPLIAPASVPAGGDVPDWLSDLAGAQPPAPPAAEPATPPPIEPVEPAAPPEPPPPASQAVEPLIDMAPPPPAPADDLDLLGGLDFGSPPVQVAPAGEDLLGMTEDLSVAPSAEQAEVEAEDVTEMGEMPEWLAESAPESLDMGGPAPAGLAEQIEDLRFDRISGGTPASTSPEKVGALKDVVGTIRAEPIFEGEKLKAGDLIEEMIVTSDQTRRIQALDELLKREAEPTPITGKRRALLPIPRLLVTAALVAATTVPLLLNIQILPPPTASENVEDAHRIIASLPDDATVLVAFEYEADAAGELRHLTDALLWDLAAHPDVTVYAVSTRLSGSMMADLAFAGAFPPQQGASQARTAVTQGGRSGGKSEADFTGTWVNLGYLPGGPNGISGLASGSPPGVPSALSLDHQGQPTGIAPASLRELSPNLIIVVTARPEDVRAWVEQAGGPTGIPILAATSASAAPLAAPYQQTGQLVALISGVNDAVGYQSVSQDEAEPALISVWNAQALGAAVAAVAILLGGIFYGLSALRERREQGR